MRGTGTGRLAFCLLIVGAWPPALAAAGPPAPIRESGDRILLGPALRADLLPAKLSATAPGVRALADHLIARPDLARVEIRAVSLGRAAHIRAALARAGVDPLRLRASAAAARSASRLRLIILERGTGATHGDADERRWMRTLSQGPPPASATACPETLLEQTRPGPIRGWACFFAGPGRALFSRWRQRAAVLGPDLRRSIAAAGLPEETFYLAMIESGLNPEARSSRGALGLWQLMPGTARTMGLRVDRHRDERRLFAPATRAALRWLGRLIRRFGHGDLAWAAYNTGPTRLARAMAALDSRDWAVLATSDRLGPEAVNYPAKIAAAKLVDRWWSGGHSRVPDDVRGPIDRPQPAP